jgi:predicted phosphate transport protein (TIGR00153 family)
MPRIKKEDEFYTLLRRLSDTLVEAGEEYVTIMRDFPATQARIPRLALYETQADECVREIMTKMLTSFITPFDREDIGELALAMDDVVDNMESITLRLDLFNLHDMRPEAIEIAELTLIAVRDIHQMIDRLPHFKTDAKVMEMSMAVGHVEDSGDAVYESALRKLFREDETRGKESLAWLRVFDRQEHCLDACDHVGSVVRNVVLKGS